MSTAVLVVLVAVPSACRSSGSDNADPAATVPHRTTTSAPTTTTTVVGQEDFTAILRDLLARRDEAYEKNDPSILDSIYATQCECLAKGKAVIEQRKAEGVHAAGPRLRLIRAEVFNRVSSEYVVLRGVVEQPPYYYVDAAGKVVRPGEPQPPESLIYELGLSGDRWQILGITREGPAS